MTHKPLWSVRRGMTIIERTTLEQEQREQAYGSSRGYCVKADCSVEAFRIVLRYRVQEGGHKPSTDERVQVVQHGAVPVLCWAAQP